MENKVIYEYHSMRKGDLDDDYIFYEDGTIEHHYDQSRFKYNCVDINTADQIGEHKKEAILEKCPLDKREIIRKMLYPEN